MFSPTQFSVGRFVPFAMALVALFATATIGACAEFRAGAATVNIDPASPESIVAGGFLEGRASTVQDPLWVRAIVLEDGSTLLALVVVDTCMMPQTLIDEAKRIASERCGIPTQHMLVSATHTHSAPAAMGCLGTRQDEAYASTLPGKIAEAIIAAHARREPARIGWGSVDDWEHTHNRRWIRHVDRKVVDPFGEPTGLANMHPGYQSPDVIGPSGPVDPTLSVISIQSLAGKPIAVYANYSQHYFGSAAISADYYGLFCKYIADMLGEPGDGNGPFVCAISQGTSGDLMWMDYGVPAENITMAQYAEGVARYAEKALDGIEYQSHAPLGCVESNLKLRYRVPSEARRKWAEPIAAKIEGDIPKSIPEVYAREAMILHERQATEIKLQSIRIGDLTIAALPNEVYALTGLKLRGRSPGSHHFNVELANGADGYIPPPEQHKLGGYTTWPARTAGLEIPAETKIVDALVEGLEQVTGKPRRTMGDDHGPYAQRVLDLKPIGYWRLNDEDGLIARNAVEGGAKGNLLGSYAWYLPGVGSGTGIGDGEALRASRFSGPTQINRAVHLVDGLFFANTDGVGDRYTLSYWFWLGEKSGASQRSGILSSGPQGERLIADQDAEHRVRLKLELPTPLDQQPRTLVSSVHYLADRWNHATVSRNGKLLRVFVNGQLQTELSIDDAPSLPSTMQCGIKLQGKLDEIALFREALQETEMETLWKTSGIEDSRVAAVPETAPRMRPLDPEEAKKSIHVPPGYRLELVASEPQVIDPVAFDWDVQGRLWVVEMADYPLGMDGKGKPGGRVRVLEDRDRDGTFERSQLFADGLSFPTGILCYRDGVIVTAAPKLWFLKDTDGDLCADHSEVLFEGFNEGNQQLRLNHPRFGLDGWVYCASGGHHPGHGVGVEIRSLRNGKTYALGSRDFRFQPETGEVVLESGPSQFGRNADAWGNWFGTQNASPLWHYVLPDRYLARNPHVPVATSVHHVVPTGSPPVYPASPLEKRYHSFEQSGHFTSACSGMIYNDNWLFGSTRTRHAFTCEPFHNLVQHNVVHDEGVSFASTRPVGEGREDFFASEDRWCRPVMVRTGPDGALWVADMVRYMIEHPDWLPPEGKEELRPHYRLGDDCGRIWKVVPDRGPRAWPALDPSNTAAMVQALDSSNDWQRLSVQQWLLWKRPADAIPLLKELARDSSRGEVRLQAAWILDGMASLDGRLLATLLADPIAEVRVGALQLAERRQEQSLIADALSLAEDDHAKVLLQLALSCGEWESEAAGATLARIANRYPQDPFLKSAVMSSSLRHAANFATAIAAGDRAAWSAYREHLLRQSVAIRDIQTIASLLDNEIDIAEKTKDTIGLDACLLDLQRIGFSVQDLSMQQVNPSLLKVADRLERWALSTLDSYRGNSSPTEPQVRSLIPLLRWSDHRDEAVELLSEQLSARHSDELQTSILRALGQSGSELVLPRIATAIKRLTPGPAAAAIDVWLMRDGWVADLIARLEKNEIDLQLLSPVQSARLRTHAEASLAQRFLSLADRVQSPDREKVMETYGDAAKQSGDAGSGKVVYQRACSACHRRGNSDGNDIGPNLASVVSHSKDKLLRNILVPSADIQPGYHALTCMLESGEVLSGVLVSENAGSIAIKQANGEVRTVARGEMEALRNTGRSLMPDGLEANISVSEMRDLLEFLQQPIAP
ncbi:MAG: PVC-type heme-binding CxxCH protein [Planctomycetota bacterium]